MSDKKVVSSIDKLQSPKSKKGAKGKGKKLGRDIQKCARYKLSKQKDKNNFLSALRSCGIPFAEKLAKQKGLSDAFVFLSIKKRKDWIERRNNRGRVDRDYAG